MHCLFYSTLVGKLSWFCDLEKMFVKTLKAGIPGWRSDLAPAFGPGHDPGDLGSNPTLGSRCMKPASPSAYVSASLSLSVTIINKFKKILKLCHIQCIFIKDHEEWKKQDQVREL